MQGGQYRLPFELKKDDNSSYQDEVLQSSHGDFSVLDHEQDVKADEKQLFTTFVSSRQQDSTLSFGNEQV